MVVVPEYNGSFPGILKYFIDLLPFPESFDCRPVSYVGVSAGQWGALRAVEQLQLVFGYRNAYVHPPRTFLLRSIPYWMRLVIYMMRGLPGAWKNKPTDLWTSASISGTRPLDKLWPLQKRPRTLE